MTTRRSCFAGLALPTEAAPQWLDTAKYDTILGFADHMSLKHKIERREARVAVIGIGYVGLPLAVEVASAGFETVGYDKSAGKVAKLNAGESYIKDVPSAELQKLVASGKLRASTDPDVLGGADIVVICVPTPLNKTKDPDN